MLYGVASIIQAVGARQVVASSGFDPLLLLTLLRRPAFVTALALMLCGFLLHLVALRTLPLYLAQSAIAASLAVTAVLSVTVYGENLNRREWSAVAAVVGGLALLPTAGGGALGLLAGRGYAVVGVSGRLLPAIGPGLITSPITYTLGFGGLLAFLLYSQALQRGSVTTVTGPMIAVQTAAPALIGVLLLGDQVRDGLAVVAVAGFALAAFGTLSLVRFEQADELSPVAAEPPASGTP